jgi:hypothetical protein
LYDSWEIALNVGFDVTIDNMKGLKGMWEKVGGVNTVEAHITNDEI